MNRLLSLQILVCVAFTSSAGPWPSAQEKNDDWKLMLKDDPRLKAPVSFKFDAKSTADEVLAALQKQTGVPVSWPGQTNNEKATFGPATVSKMPAWKVMELLASRQIKEGNWAKSKDGYILQGTPLNFGPPPVTDAAKAAKKAHEEKLAQAAMERDEFARRHPLGVDTDLHARLTVVEKHPKLWGESGEMREGQALCSPAPLVVSPYAA